jgi:hypothetical protein
MPVLHELHNHPRNSPVAWSWSRLIVVFGTLPQFSHTSGSGRVGSGSPYRLRAKTLRRVVLALSTTGQFLGKTSPE